MKKNKKIDPEANEDDSLDSEFENQSAEDQRGLSNNSRASRGRPLLPDAWTRVINIDDYDIDNIRVHAIAPDLIIMPNLPTGSTPRKAGYTKPYFFPITFERENKEITLEKFALPENRLK